MCQIHLKVNVCYTVHSVVCLYVILLVILFYVICQFDEQSINLNPQIKYKGIYMNAKAIEFFL